MQQKSAIITLAVATVVMLGEYARRRVKGALRDHSRSRQVAWFPCAEFRNGGVGSSGHMRCSKNTNLFDYATASFDDLACGNLQCQQNCEAEGLCSLQIDYRFELDRHLDG